MIQLYTYIFFFKFFNIFKINFIYLFIYWAALGFHCARAFSSCGGERGLLFVAVCRLLIAVASLVAEHRLQACGLPVVMACGLSSCGTRAQ